MPAQRRRPMCPVTDKVYYRTILGGRTRRECWGAASAGPDGQADGIWRFAREESSGTPWLVWHLPSVADETLPVPVDQMGSLPACREAVARGWLDAMLPERKAEWAAHMAKLARICTMADYDESGRCRYCRQPPGTHNPVASAPAHHVGLGGGRGDAAGAVLGPGVGTGLAVPAGQRQDDRQGEHGGDQDREQDRAGGGDGTWHDDSR